MDLDVDLYEIFFSVYDAVIEDNGEWGESDKDDIEDDVQYISCSSSSICSGHDFDGDIEVRNSESA